MNAGPFASWHDMNQPQYSRNFITDDTMQFLFHGIPRKLGFLEDAYKKLPSRIMQLDFIRYLEMFRNGGVYVDFDTNCLVPIEQWYAACYPANTINGKDLPPARRPGLLVGVEFDTTLSNDQPIQDRRIGIANYVFAANKGHPALAQMLASIIETLQTVKFEDSETSEPFTVYATTGRRLWTDTIIGYLQQSTRGFSDHDLAGLTSAKVVNDICILPQIAFGLGQDKNDSTKDAIPENGAFVKHFFMKSWLS